MPGLAQPRFALGVTPARHLRTKGSEGPAAAASSDQNQAVSPAKILGEWTAAQDHGGNGAGLPAELKEPKVPVLAAERAEPLNANDAPALHPPVESLREPTLTPLRFTLLAFLILWLGIRPAIFTLDESFTHSLLANPLPTVSYRTDELGGRSGCGRVGTLSPRRSIKFLADVKWRIRNISTSGGKAALGLASLTIVLAGVLVIDPTVSAHIRPAEVGWNAVAGRWLYFRPMRLASDSAATVAGARGWTPLRNLIWLEVSSRALCSRSCIPKRVYTELKECSLDHERIRLHPPRAIAGSPSPRHPSPDAIRQFPPSAGTELCA